MGSPSKVVAGSFLSSPSSPQRYFSKSGSTSFWLLFSVTFRCPLSSLDGKVEFDFIPVFFFTAESMPASCVDGALVSSTDFSLTNVSPVLFGGELSLFAPEGTRSRMSLAASPSPATANGVRFFAAFNKGSKAAGASAPTFPDNETEVAFNSEAVAFELLVVGLDIDAGVDADADVFFFLLVPILNTPFPKPVFFTRPNRKMAIVLKAAAAPTTKRPTPQATPTAALTHIAAAVVSPLTEDCLSYTPAALRLLVMTPAPMKPTPEATLLAIRLGSNLAPDTLLATDRKPYILQTVNAAAPRETRAIVRTPAGLSELDRSRPTAAPPKDAAKRRILTSISAFVGKTRSVPRGRESAVGQDVEDAAASLSADSSAATATAAADDDDVADDVPLFTALCIIAKAGDERNNAVAANSAVAMKTIRIAFLRGSILLQYKYVRLSCRRFFAGIVATRDRRLISVFLLVPAKSCIVRRSSLLSGSRLLVVCDGLMHKGTEVHGEEVMPRRDEAAVVVTYAYCGAADKASTCSRSIVLLLHVEVHVVPLDNASAVVANATTRILLVLVAEPDMCCACEGCRCCLLGHPPVPLAFRVRLYVPSD
mmetsp:Transcript_17541/g.38344  ORF Transcript_17541/g.38344 Transcript_17541/m.38344 type:complete len:595 (-) Transcript_17541:193-1977(-)